MLLSTFLLFAVAYCCLCCRFDVVGAICTADFIVSAVASAIDILFLPLLLLLLSFIVTFPFSLPLSEAYAVTVDCIIELD